MIGKRLAVAGVVAAAWATGAAAQERDVRAELGARGAPAVFVEQVGVLVDQARAQGLPPGPLADKALEGWAKHVPPERVVLALEQVRTRLADGRQAARGAGLADPPGPVIAAAGEALGRGMTPGAIQELIRTAPTADDAAAGLSVAASLAAQGLEMRAAVRAVQQAYGRGRGPTHLFELPSAVADLAARGVPMSDVARRILQGGGLPLPPMVGGQGKGQGPPSGVPRGPPVTPPGKAIGKQQ
ncbi:MAG: hypothetical protein OER21_12440 [Gemmatimonadota bacterium]|nr:hypothetical protein [Gemmatimonadota bacterium]